MATAHQRAHFDTYGWVVIPGVLDAETARTVAASIRKEVLPVALRGVDIADMETKLAAKNRDVSELITDSKLRAEFHVPDTAIREQGNTRKPFVSISKGMANIYYNEQVRDHVLLNPKVVGAIEALYQDLLGPYLRLVPSAGSGSAPRSEPTPTPDVGYILGRDRVGFKPKGATDMDIHLDKNLFSGKPWPYRVQAFVNLSSHTDKAKGGDERKRSGLTSRQIGGIELLSGSHRVFDLLAYWYGREVGPATVKSSGDVIPQELRTGFLKKDLPRFLHWLKNLFEPDKLAQESEEVRALFAKSGLAKCPEIKLVAPAVEPGDLVCWDQRLAHRNTLNKSSTVRIVAYVSLFPKAYKNVKATLRELFADKAGNGHAGSNRQNAAERKLFATNWDTRTSVPDTPTSRKLLAEAERKDADGKAVDDTVAPHESHNGKKRKSLSLLDEPVPSPHKKLKPEPSE